MTRLRGRDAQCASSTKNAKMGSGGLQVCLVKCIIRVIG